MARISELFEKFQLNQRNGIEFRDQMFSLIPKDDWETLFSEKMIGLGNSFRENIAIFAQMDEIINGEITEEQAEELYNGLEKMFDVRSQDYRFMVPILDRVISYYEEKQAYGRLAGLYMWRYYEINEVKHRQFSIKKMDFTDLDHCISLIDFYSEIESVKARIWIWSAFYSKIVIGLDTESLTPKEAFSLYDNMMTLWNLDEVQKIDGDNGKMLQYVSAVKRNLTDAIYTIDGEDEETKKRFCQIVKDNYFYEYKLNKNEYDLDATIYASHLYVPYLQNEQNIEVIFDDLMDYYKVGSLKYLKEESLSDEALVFFTNTSRILHAWSLKGISKEKSRKMYASFVVLSEKTWKQVDPDKVPVLNELMRQICRYISTDTYREKTAEEMVFRLIHQRNFFSYINARQIMALSSLIFTETYQYMPYLYGQYEDLGYDNLKIFVEEAAKLHDIGVMDMIPFLYTNLYPMSEEEQIKFTEHPDMGAFIVARVPGLEKYQDIVLGHHKYYDGSKGFPKDYDNTVSKDRIISDIIFLADEIDSSFDPFLSKEKNLPFDGILKELEANKGTKYNPDLVDCILSHKDFSDKILKIVSEEKTKIMFQYYHDLENVMIHQDIDEFIKEIEGLLVEASQTHDTKAIPPYLDRLYEYAAREQSDLLFGKAYYLNMYYHNYNNEYMSAINCGLEAARYFEKVDSYEYLASIYNNVGLNMGCQGNIENGIGHFLQAVEYAELANNQRRKGMAYNNLANIFKHVNLLDKALEYYDLAEVCFGDNEQLCLALYCNQIYCHIQLDNREKVDELRDKLHRNPARKDLKEKDVDFTTKYYEAIICQYYHDEEGLEKWLNLISDDLDFFQEYILYIEEINLYTDLLIKLKRYQDLSKQLDKYINFCRENKISHYMVNVLLQKRIMCAFLAKDYKTSYQLSEELGKIIEEQKSSQADVISQLENAFMKDIQRQKNRTEIENENQKLEKKVAEAQSASDAKSTFLSSMSHEIRTPIHAVIGLDEMILRESKEEHVLQYAKDIQSAGQNLLNIVNDVLDFSKMEAGKVQIISEEYELADLIGELVDTYQKKAREKKIAFLVDCDPILPKTLYGDSVRIKQILHNLISNSVKFTEEGNVTFLVKQLQRENHSVKLQFIVKDSGIGIRKEEQENILKPFERADEERNRSIEGTGLGLSIVNMLVEKMNGSLILESEYGKGSEFSVLLNQRYIGNEMIGEIQFMKEKMEEKPLIAPYAKVLVVDDNAVNIKVVTSLLKRTKMQITSARSGHECLEICKKEEFQLILLDHLMPEMDGIETLKHLREKENLNQSVPVIAMTANSGSGAMEFYSSAGFSDFIPKPVDFHVLEAKISKHLPEDYKE